MKLTNLQRETIVKNIYNEILKSQADYINSEIDKNLAKKIAEYKKTPEYRTYLKLEELDKLDGVSISVNSDSIFYAESSGWRNDLKSVEEIVAHKYKQELKSTLKTPDRKEIEDKLILKTIGDFNFEEFKNAILAEFAI